MIQEQHKTSAILDHLARPMEEPVMTSSDDIIGTYRTQLSEVINLIKNNKLPEAISYLEATMPKNIVNSLHGQAYHIEKSAGHVTKHHRFGKVAFYKLDGYDMSDENRISAIEKIQETLPQLIFNAYTEDGRQVHLKRLFPNSDLQKALIGDDKEGKLKERNFATNLLRLPQDKRDAMITCYLEALKSWNETDERNKVRRFFDKFLIEITNTNVVLPENLKVLAKEVYALFITNQGKYKVLHDSDIDFGKYSEATHPLSRFGELAQDTRFIERHCELVDQHCAQSPEMADLYVKQNESELSDTGYGPEFEVKLPSMQHLLLIPHPSPNKLDAFCDMLVAKKVALVITLCSPGYETNDRTPLVTYFDNTILKGHDCLTDGRSIRCIANQVLHTSTIETKQGFGRIIHRELLVSNGTEEHTVNHLQYENWPDVQSAPDIDLLMHLHNARHNLLQDLSQPVIVHCRKGVGRTSNVSLTDCCIQKIRNELADGKKLDEITLNPFEIIFEMRKSRPDLVCKLSQLRQTYQIVGKFYDQLKNL